jgi:hypothetical protein
MRTRVMNATKLAYAKAHNAYQKVLERITADLENNDKYMGAKFRLTQKLAKKDSELFDQLNQFICEVEDAVERRHRRWELFAELIRAEMSMIRAFCAHTKSRPDMPAVIPKLFSEASGEILEMADALRPKVVKIIFMDEHF